MLDIGNLGKDTKNTAPRAGRGRGGDRRGSKKSRQGMDEVKTVLRRQRRRGKEKKKETSTSHSQPWKRGKEKKKGGSFTNFCG